jgi:hypothetical protein
VLLGWRHEPDGSCAVRLRFVVGGLRRSTWLPLADVRLPEPAAVPPSPGPSSRPADGPRTRPDVLLTPAPPPRSAPALTRI